MAEQDELTRYFFEMHHRDLEELALGEECSTVLPDEVSEINETPLDESVGETSIEVEEGPRGISRGSSMRTRTREIRTPVKLDL